MKYRDFIYTGIVLLSLLFAGCTEMPGFSRSPEAQYTADRIINNIGSELGNSFPVSVSKNKTWQSKRSHITETGSVSVTENGIESTKDIHEDTSGASFSAGIDSKNVVKASASLIENILNTGFRN